MHFHLKTKHLEKDAEKLLQSSHSGNLKNLTTKCTI
jgi:hypothetical protein